jgi:glycerol-3-phosphate dehydrogenase (NAD+)
MEKTRVAVVGGGNWGSAIAKLAAENLENNERFEKEIKMWIYEEEVDGKSLVSIINEKHENVKYLEGVSLPENVVATSSLGEVAGWADVFIFVVPHEFLDRVVRQMAEAKKLRKGAIGVSLIKGAVFGESKVELLSAHIAKSLGIRVSVLMGANIAGDVARGKISEGTLGYEEEDDLYKLIPIFNSAKYRVTPVQNVGIPELCGVVKNVVALGCGFSEGKGLGANFTAALIRNGFLEMIRFCDSFLADTSTEKGFSRIFLESSGIADLIVTCTGGRNYRFSKIAAERDISLDQVEKQEMNGQKLQGYSTSKELYAFLERKGKLEKFPLLATICQAAAGKTSIDKLEDKITPSYKQTGESYTKK